MTGSGGTRRSTGQRQYLRRSPQPTPLHLRYLIAGGPEREGLLLPTPCHRPRLQLGHGAGHRAGGRQDLLFVGLRLLGLLVAALLTLGHVRRSLPAATIRRSPARNPRRAPDPPPMDFLPDRPGRAVVPSGPSTKK